MFQVKLSVRELVEFVLREGDIDNTQGGGNLVERALEGARLHRRLQKEAGEEYEAEVFLSHEEVLEDILYHVEGRADGIFETPQGDVIDEIKTVEFPLDRLTEEYQPLHWAQAKCYGYIWALKNELSGVFIRLTYCQTETGETRRFIREFKLSELRDFFLGLLRGYRKWAEFSRDWKARCQGSAKALLFPFGAYRPGQRQMAAAVYRSIRDGKRLFCQAPTGIGKTMSALFPAVKAIGEGCCEKIFYLTARTTTRQAAWDAAGLLSEKGLSMKTILLTAKDTICPMEERSCNPMDCPRAAGHYDRVNEAIYALLQDHDRIGRARLEEYGERYRVCPFELGLDVSLWCDLVICDYNYLFDPQASLKRFFGEKERKGEHVFLIDEAHNLPDRARDMYSTTLRKSDVLELRRKAGDDRRLKNLLSRLNAAFLDLKRIQGEEEEAGGYSVYEKLPERFCKATEKFAAGCQEWLDARKESPLRKEVLELYFDVLFFNKLTELYDSHFTTTVSTGKTESAIRILCLDPSALVDTSLGKGRAAALFSATLSPISYFQKVLGCEEAAFCSLPSPYPRENRRLFIAGRVSTKYADRERTLEQVIRLLTTFVSARKGNYLLYFPSYRYMEEAVEQFRECIPQVELLVQSPSMTDAEKEEFLTRFVEEPAGTVVGFCVLGGIYAEGIDLKGERLIGTAVVGVGLPQVNREQELLRSYYEKTMGGGFAFAYQYPGMNKVLQAAGRVIRSETDRGAVLFIDSRFSQYAYRRLLPPHWEDCRQSVSAPGELEEALLRFWREGEDKKNEMVFP